VLGADPRTTREKIADALIPKHQSLLRVSYVVFGNDECFYASCLSQNTTNLRLSVRRNPLGMRPNRPER
jgi:hypothetical protein